MDANLISTVLTHSNTNMQLSDFLFKHLVKTGEASEERPITNTRIGDTPSGIYGGSYHIPDAEYDQFLKILYKSIIEKNGKEYLTEKQLDANGPIAIDIDLRFKYDVTERIYTKDHINDIILLYLDELKQIYQFDETTNFNIYVLEKATVNRVNEKQITKDGIHIIIGLQADRVVQTYLRSKIVEIIDDVWGELPITNTWSDVFDEGISTGKTNWQLIGCRKPGFEAYQLKYVYNVHVDETDGEVMMPLVDVKKSLNIDNIAKLSIRYRDHPSLFMTSSFITIYEKIKGVTVARKPRTSGGAGAGAGGTTAAPLDILNIRNADQLKSMIDYFLESITKQDYLLKETYQFTMTLPEPYYGANSFMKWIRVGWALRNISDRLFIVWVAFSAQTSTFDYSSIRDDLWERWIKFDTHNPDGLTERSIMHWSKKDNLEGYKKARFDSVDFYMDEALDIATLDSNNTDKRSKVCGDYDIAKVLYHLFKDEYVCVSIKGAVWYRYKNHRWAEIDSGTTLRNAISEELRDIFTRKSVRLNALACREVSNEDKANHIKDKASKILEICARLGRTNDKKNIMTEARELFWDENFLKTLDTNSYLTCFKNGVIDFKEKKFRPGYPEDNLSKCTNIDYVKLNPAKHGKTMEEIHNFMNKLFPNIELRNYAWDFLASTMLGLTTNQTFNMFIGGGSNGKSKLIDLMKKVLGEYCNGDTPLTLITQPRTKIGSASPEIASLKGVRLAVMQEASKGDKIIEGQMKALTGGDPLTGRALYMDNVTFIPQFKLVVCSNEFMDVKSNDHGTWRRICVVDFESLFTETPVSNDPDKPHQFKLDKHIDEKFNEWAPILASMLIERAFITMGDAQIPEIVKRASNAYRERQDYISEFIRDRIVRSPNDCVQKAMLANVFKEWYNTNYGMRIPNLKDVTAYMDKQFGKAKNAVWLGIRVVYDNEHTNVTAGQHGGQPPAGQHGGQPPAGQHGGQPPAQEEEGDDDIDDIDIREI